ncbi:MAG: GtrA family protein [Pseudomonadota bacterium]
MTGAHRFIRFAIVGSAVAGLYVLLYLAFLSIGLAQPVANAAAFLLAVAVQYIGQAGFTFQSRLNDAPQITRFAIMIGCGLITSAVITGLVGPALALPHWAAAAIVTIILPLQNYVIMTRWVFAHGSQHVEKPQ